MKNELTFIKMQEIVNNIIEEEKEKYGIELSGGLVNFVQYYKEYLKDDKFNLPSVSAKELAPTVSEITPTS